jgi:hypothetical protein
MAYDPKDPGVGPDGEPLAGRDLMERAREIAGDTILLSFSGGKDSIAMYLALRDHFEVIPYFLYWMPGLSFVEEAMDYYEEYFGQEIMRLPHPLFYKLLREYAYQPPDNVAPLASLKLVDFDFADVDNIIAQHYGLENPFCAIGMRVKDNIDRRNLIQQKGVLGIGNRRYYYAIWDWDVNQVGQIILDHGVKLSKEYKYWGRTLASFDYQYLRPLKEHFPDDFKRMMDWFPLLDLEFFRYEQVGK